MSYAPLVDYIGYVVIVSKTDLQGKNVSYN